MRGESLRVENVEVSCRRSWLRLSGSSGSMVLEGEGGD